MARTRTPVCIPRSGIKHNTNSARTHDATLRGFDWLWFLVALLAVAVIDLL